MLRSPCLNPWYIQWWLIFLHLKFLEALLKWDWHRTERSQVFFWLSYSRLQQRRGGSLMDACENFVSASDIVRTWFSKMFIFLNVVQRTLITRWGLSRFKLCKFLLINDLTFLCMSFSEKVERNISFSQEVSRFIHRSKHYFVDYFSVW